MIKDHRIRVKRWVWLISDRHGGPVGYEPPWRYYYIVRNSTVLLMEGSMDFNFYLQQLRHFGLGILLVDGFWVFMKSLELGILHALLGELGYLGREYLR